tara:strand:+ start:104 stop:946 length:843 start_codon:yes stop_codon:yes gene_type:complete
MIICRTILQYTPISNSKVWKNISLIEKIKKSEDLRRVALPEPILAAHQPEFLPWLGYISKATMCDVYFILDTVQFRKEYFHNRNKIRNKNKGLQWLTIPVLEGKKRLINLSEVKINDKINWQRKHLSAIKTSYSRTQYFDKIYSELEKIYYEFDGEFLVEFVISIIKYAFNKFEINIPIYRTSELKDLGFDIDGQKSDLAIQMCKSVGAKSFIFGQEGRNYIEKEKFSRNNIEFVFQKFVHPNYSQLYSEFIPKMSFIDLLFNHGNKSPEILKKSDYEKT